MLTLAGEIDLACSDDVAALGTSALADPRVQSLTLDLTAVTFLDSTGLGALVRICDLARDLGKVITWCDPGVQVQGLLMIIGLDAVFTAVPEPGTGVLLGDLTSFSVQEHVRNRGA